MNQKSLYKVKKIKEHSHTNSFKLLVKDVRTTKTSIGVAILTSVQNFGYYGIMIWLPNFLSKQLGFLSYKIGFVDSRYCMWHDGRHLVIWTLG